eukprot:Ihof_evm14s23 gene=Ihof_evmTU14s23
MDSVKAQQIMKDCQKQFEELVDQLNRDLGNKEPFKTITEKAKVPAGYLALGAGAIFVLVFWFIGQPLFINLIGFAYPAYCSIKAIESPSAADDKQWLTYWTVFSLFNIIEFFSDVVLYWLPFYYYLKIASIAFLLLPQTQGATVIYNKVIRPYIVNGSCLEGNMTK